MSKGKKSSGRSQRVRYGRQSVFSWIGSAFAKVVNSAAYGLRIFLRIRLGERAIGLPTVLLSFVWVCYFLTDDYAIEFVGEDAASQAPLAFLEPFMQVFSFIGQVLTKALNAFVNAFYQLGVSDPEYIINMNVSKCISIYSYIVLFLGIVHLIKIQLRATSKIHVHSYTRGKSAFFWWLEGRSIPWLRGDKQTGKFIGTSVKIAEKTIFTYVEPVTVIFLGVLFGRYGEDNIAWYLIISAFALMWDERRESVRFRGQVLDMLDGELDGQDLIEEYKKIKGEAVEGGNFERGARIAR